VTNRRDFDETGSHPVERHVASWSPGDDELSHAALFPADQRVSLENPNRFENSLDNANGRGRIFLMKELGEPLEIGLGLRAVLDSNQRLAPC
jgi:hypothetical protein